MLSGIKGWFVALSLGKKIAVVATASVLGIAGSGGGTNNQAQNQEPPKEVKAATQSIEIKEQKPAPKVETRTETKTEVIPFESSTVKDTNLEQGKTVVRTEGKNGVKTITYEVTYTDDTETSRKLISEAVTTSAVTKVIAQGTKVAVAPRTAPSTSNSNCDPNYTPCVPNVSYDLDCPDIGFRVQVIGNDRHGFDGNDNDGWGCESYR